MKNILIIGHSKWIWYYLCKNLSEKYNIFWVARNWSDCRCSQYKVDLTKEKDIKWFVQKIPNILFNTVIFNAWIGFFWDFWEIDIQNHINIIKTNLVSHILLLYYLKDCIISETKLIFIWSVAGKKVFRFWASYQASKFWLRWFVLSISKELKNKVYIINPKIVETDFYKNCSTNINWYEKTSLKTILQTVENIIEWKENKTEIDL